MEHSTWFWLDHVACRGAVSTLNKLKSGKWNAFVSRFVTTVWRLFCIFATICE